MLWLKKLMIILPMLALGFAGGGLVGFALGYIIAGDGRSNIPVSYTHLTLPTIYSV